MTGVSQDRKGDSSLRPEGQWHTPRGEGKRIRNRRSQRRLSGKVKGRWEGHPVRWCPELRVRGAWPTGGTARTCAPEQGAGRSRSEAGDVGGAEWEEPGISRIGSWEKFWSGGRAGKVQLRTCGTVRDPARGVRRWTGGQTPREVQSGREWAGQMSRAELMDHGSIRRDREAGREHRTWGQANKESNPRSAICWPRDTTKPTLIACLYHRNSICPEGRASPPGSVCGRH